MTNNMNPLKTIREALEFYAECRHIANAYKHIPEVRIVCGAEDKAKEALRALDKFPHVIPIKSITLGSALKGRISEREAVELINDVINSQIELSTAGFTDKGEI